MEDIIVRNMNLEDIDDVLAIEEESFTTPWTRNALETEVKGNSLARYIVVEKDGKVVAYGGMWIIFDGAHITNIAVRKQERGKGYGEEVVKSIIQVSKDLGLNNILLEVRVGNEVAKNLYRKYGFEQIGIREKYYQDDNEDALVMELEIGR